MKAAREDWAGVGHDLDWESRVPRPRPLLDGRGGRTSVSGIKACPTADSPCRGTCGWETPLCRCACVCGPRGRGASGLRARPRPSPAFCRGGWRVEAGDRSAGGWEGGWV